MKVSFALLVCFFFSCTVWGQGSPGDKIDPALLKKDLALFHELLQKEHAGLYRYKSKPAIDHLFDSCAAATDQALTQLEFARTIMFIISSIQDGHTRSSVFGLLMNYYADRKLFPLYPYFTEDKTYVLCGNITTLPPETEIIAVDGHTMGDLKKEIFKYFPSDGSIETKKMLELNDGAFPILYSWLFGEKDSFNVQYLLNGETFSTTIPARQQKDLGCDFKKKPSVKKPLQLDMLSETAALLTVKRFIPDKQNGMTLNFREFMDSAFNEIGNRKIQDLVIDLRWNGGGEDNLGALLYAYLTAEPFRYFASKETTARTVTVQENPLLGLQQPMTNNYKGRVYLLVNGSSFSTTADFCATVRSNQRGKFIGEETGGGYYGNTSGSSVTNKLPGSQISVTIPQYKYVNAVKEAKYPDRGTLADYVVMPTIKEVIRQEDVQMRFVMELINKTK